MSTQTAQSNDWIQLQANVFTRWVQNQLKDHSDIHIDTITKDLSNGVALVQLAKTLTQKGTPRNWAPSPKRTVEMVQNCDLAVEMFTKDGVNLVGISGKDINDNNEKLILGLIWSLILYYSIGKSVQAFSKDNKQQITKENSKDVIKNETKILKSWAIERTENYPNIHNFTPYELSMCALLDSYVPSKINYYSLNPNDSEHNSALATDVMKELGIPIFIYPEDVKGHSSQIDDKTLLTQLSSMKTVLEEQEFKLNSIKNDEKSDVESESETTPENNEFSNTLFEENQFDQESMIKAESVDTENRSINSSNQPLIDEFSNKLFEEYEFDQESIIKADFGEQTNLTNEQSVDEFSNRIFEDNDFDEESKIKAESAGITSRSVETRNQPLIDDFELKIIDDNSTHHEPQTKDSTQQQEQQEQQPLPDFEIKLNDQIPNRYSMHINDHTVDHDFDIEISSREARRARKGKYLKLHTKQRKISFFEWLFTEVLVPYDSVINRNLAGTHPHAQVFLLNSPITPFYYYIDYNRP